MRYVNADLGGQPSVLDKKTAPRVLVDKLRKMRKKISVFY